MKAYAFDYSGKFMGELEADLDPENEKKRARNPKLEKAYIIPANSTLAKPTPPNGKDAFFIDGKWEYREPAKVIEPEKPKPYVPTYKEKRAAEYPLINEYVDAMVKINSGEKDLEKEGQEQLKEYIRACLAIKAKYPKE